MATGGRQLMSMAKHIQYRRLMGLAVLLGAAFFGLGYRLVELQVLRHDDLKAKADQNARHEVLRPPRRGDIVDAKGNLLATSVDVKTVCADPSLLGNRQAEMARVLSPWLKTAEATLADRLKPRVLRVNAEGQPVYDRHVVLKEKVSVETWRQIQETLARESFGLDTQKLNRPEKTLLVQLRRKAIFAESAQLRTYPNQTLAAHVLGFVQAGPPTAPMAGVEGIEKTWDDKLAGVTGWRVTETDRLRRELVTRRDQDLAPRDGFNVVLTIDSVVQNMLETALAEGMEKNAPLSISGLVVRPRTGEILALATLPNFDPNKPGPDADARRNRVITDIMEPGSTFKIVPVSAALNEQLIRMSDLFDCEHGHFVFGGRVLHDHEAYGMLSVQNIIKKSSNIGAAKVGIRLGSQRLYDYMRDFGFGARTGIPLPAEDAGIVHPVEKWSKVSIAQIPMGHGVAVTRLQMIMAMCAIANKGALMQPMLVHRIEDREGHVVAQYTPQRVRQVISETAAKQMVAALKTVVQPDGTAPKAALEHYTVAGKTGTAQKAGPGGYVPGKYVASFIGFLPADNPEICIAIMLDEPKHGYYGGQTAAPLFRQVAERAASYLNLPPDLGPELPKPSEPLAAEPDGGSVKSASARPATNP